MIYTPCPYYSCFTRSMTSFSKKISMTEAVYALVKRSDEERKKHPERFTNPSLDQWRLWIVEDKWYKNFPKVSKIAGRDLQITKEEIINRVFYQTYNLTEKSNSLLKCFLCQFTDSLQFGCKSFRFRGHGLFGGFGNGFEHAIRMAIGWFNERTQRGVVIAGRRSTR